jgi:hypothetical protein
VRIEGADAEYKMRGAGLCFWQSMVRMKTRSNIPCGKLFGNAKGMRALLRTQEEEEEGEEEEEEEEIDHIEPNMKSV